MTEINPTIVTKMSVKTLKAKPERAKIDEKEIPLVRIYGTAQGVVYKVDQNGDPVSGITGTFEGVNLETSEVFQSGILYLPGGVHEMLLSAVETGEEDNKGRPVYSTVEFAFDISAVPASNKIGYAYNAKQLIKASTADPMAEVRAKIAAALPAPAEQKQVEQKK